MTPSGCSRSGARPSGTWSSIEARFASQTSVAASSATTAGYSSSSSLTMSNVRSQPGHGGGQRLAKKPGLSTPFG